MSHKSYESSSSKQSSNRSTLGQKMHPLPLSLNTPATQSSSRTPVVQSHIYHTNHSNSNTKVISTPQTQTQTQSIHDTTTATKTSTINHTTSSLPFVPILRLD